MASLIALIILGQALSAERAISEPVLWPSGQSPQVALTATGLVFSMVDKANRSVLRVMAADGTIGAPLDIGASVTPVALATTSLGVLALLTPRSDSTLVARLFDAATGQPLGPPHPLGMGDCCSGPMITSRAGRVLWARRRPLLDGGLATWVTPLNSDGTAGGDVDLSELGAITAYGSNAQAHWFATRLSFSDGGLGTRLTAVADDGQVISRSVTEGLVNLMIPTEHFVFIIVDPVGQPSNEGWAFVDFDGGTFSRGAIDGRCGSIAGTAVGDEVWLGCSKVGASLRPEGLGMVQIAPDGGTRASTLLSSDGGELQLTQVVTRPVPTLFFERVFKELHRGNWKATYVLPLSADGLLAAGEALPALLRPSSQSYPSFASREPGVPNALAWNDDRQLPGEPLVEVTRVSSSGTLGPPRQMERLFSQFTNVNAEGRLISTDGTTFLLNASGGFEVVPIEWPFDGGPGQPRASLTTTFGLFGAPMLAPASQALGAGYVATWYSPSRSNARRVDSHGVAVGDQVDLPSTGPVHDLLALETKQLQALSENGRLRIISIEPTTGVLAPFAEVAQVDAGIAAARMARSGSTILVAWHAQDPIDGTPSVVSAARFDLEGAALDAVPFRTEVASRQYMRHVTDIGVRNGVFHVLGAAATPDGGSALWLWRISDDGKVIGANAFDDIGPVSGVVAGPTIDDGSMLLAYGRHHPDYGSPVQQVFVRSMGDPLTTGLPCERDTDCESGFCTSFLCCATEHGCDGGAQGGIGIYQRCGCDGGGSLSALTLFILVAARRRGERAR